MTDTHIDPQTNLGTNQLIDIAEQRKLYLLNGSPSYPDLHLHTARAPASRSRSRLIDGFNYISDREIVSVDTDNFNYL